MRRLLTTLAVTAILSFSLFLPSAALCADSKAGKQSKAAPAAADRCIAKTQDGDQCKRKASAGKYCWQHDPNRKSKSAKKA